jgi:hypothetical protein
MRRLRDKYTKKEIIKETVRKKKKKNKNKNNKIITKEIERIKEHFNERGLMDDLVILLRILDKIEAMMKREEEREKKMKDREREKREYDMIIERLKSIVKMVGKREIAKRLKIKGRAVLDKILSGNKNYPYNLYEKLKKMLE